MSGKKFLTKIITAIMALTIIVSFAAQTQVHAFEKTATYKAKIIKVCEFQFELTIGGRKISDATINSTCGTLALSDGFEAARDRIITSFNLNPNNYNHIYTYINFKDGDFLNDLFSNILPKYDPDKYTCKQKNDVVNIIYFTTYFFEDLWKIQRAGTTLYCNMF